MKILVVEDSERLRRSLARGLRQEGHAVDVAADGPEGLAFLDSYEFDVLILDLMLPGLDGLEVLRRLREADNPVHVLILSARDQVEDRVRGLEMGADDYLVKPFAFDELCARLQALVRRRHGAKNPCLQIGPLWLDTNRKEVRRGDRPIHLTPTEFALFQTLALRPGRVFSKHQLVDQLYHSEAEVSSNVIEVLISGLRKKIHIPGEPPVVQTRRGHGYLIDLPDEG